MNPATKYLLLKGGTLLLIAAGAVSFPGCAVLSSMPPIDYFAEYQHVSHLSAGKPFGPSTEEDSLNHLSLCASSKALVTTELCYGYKLSNGGFYGPRDTAVLRVRVPLPLSSLKGKFE